MFPLGLSAPQLQLFPFGKKSAARPAPPSQHGDTSAEDSTEVHSEGYSASFGPTEDLEGEGVELSWTEC